jgi:uncharacterized coiled-coil protein SlyX
MKVPAVRRVMLRLANAEAAIAGQRAQLGQLDALLQQVSANEADHRTLLAQISEHMPPARRASLDAAIAQQQAQLGHVNEHIRRLMADDADQRALLAEVAEHMPPVRLKQLEATIAEQHALLAEVAMHMPPARQAELEATIKGQETAIKEQEAAIKGQEVAIKGQEAAIKGQQAQIGALTQRVQQLSAEHDSQRAVLTEVSQHLPPAQRANLEATLHGQQLQLGALNSTIHANQIQLGSLNDVVQRLSAENASQRALLAEVSAQVPPARLAGLEATVAELQTQLRSLNDIVPRLTAGDVRHHADGSTELKTFVRIFVICTPKSGSSFVVTLLQKITGFGHLNPTFGGEPMLEADPYLPNMESVEHPSVSQLHCYAKPRNLTLCEKFFIKPIFLTRNIFDSLLSMKEYIDSISHHELFPHYYNLPTEKDKRTFIINVYAPIFVRLAAGWHEACKEKKAPILWCTYETFFKDPFVQVSKMLNHLGLDYPDRQIHEAIEATQKEATTTKFNKGVSGRGMSSFTPEEQRRIIRLIHSFKGFDAIKAGILA